MVESGVDTTFGHSQQLGHFKVGGSRRQGITLPVEVDQPAAVESCPPFVYPAAVGIKFATGLVLGHQPAVEGHSPAFHKLIAAMAPIVGPFPQAVLTGLQPGQIDSTVLADSLEVDFIEVGSGLKGQKHKPFSSRRRQGGKFGLFPSRNN
jgi:hypothetical protein